jgi:quinol-cytochrome oxidoreductase complex cytochrome b subunit
MTNKLTKLSIAGAGYLSTLFMVGTVFATGVGDAITPGIGWASNIGSLINTALNLVMVVALLLVFLYLILGGIQWITSGGDKGKTEEARNKITAAVIGIIILAAAYALVTFVAYILGFSDFSSAIQGVKRINDATS